MPKAKVPERLQPSQVEIDDPQVPIDMAAQRTYEPSQINSLQNLGLIKLDGERLRSLGEIGKSVKSLGVVNLIHGGFIISLDNLAQAIAWAGRTVQGIPEVEGGEIPTRAERLKAGELLAILTDKLGKLNSGVTKVEQARAEVALKVDKQRRQSFQPGMVISAEQSGKPLKPA